MLSFLYCLAGFMKKNHVTLENEPVCRFSILFNWQNRTLFAHNFLVLFFNFISVLCNLESGIVIIQQNSCCCLRFFSLSLMFCVAIRNLSFIFKLPRSIAFGILTVTAWNHFGQHWFPLNQSYQSMNIPIMVSSFPLMQLLKLFSNISLPWLDLLKYILKVIVRGIISLIFSG